jgi:hypothetical protein
MSPPGLLDVLADLPCSVVVSVGVMPIALPEPVVAFADENAVQFARLTRPAEWREPGDVYRPAQRLDAEPFAGVAAGVYARAASSYRTWCGRLRIAVLGSGPVDDGVAATLVEALVPAGGSRTGDWFGLRRPASSTEHAAFTATMDVLGYGGWSRPTACAHAALRTLAVVADADECATALGLHRRASMAQPRNRERALTALTAACRALERMQVRDQSEEGLRDILVVALSSALPGSTYAEARQGQGHTDVLVRIGDETVLVVECKILRRPGWVGKGIGQLLSYLTARDRDAALVVFGFGLAPEELHRRTQDIVREHPSYLRAAACTEGTVAVLRSRWNTDVTMSVLTVALPPVQ